MSVAMDSSQQPHYRQLHPSFQHNQFLIRRKILALIGAKLHVFDPNENMVLFCQMKGFKLKEDIRIYTDESQGQQLLAIRARKVLDISSAYDVFDTSTGQEHKIGVLKRKGMKSIFRDEWEIWDVNDQPIGMIQEESGWLAFLRRIVEYAALFAPQQFNFSVGGHSVGSMKQNRNPFVMKMTADFSQDTQGYLDRRLAAAAATLLCVIEGKQS